MERKRSQIILIILSAIFTAANAGPGSEIYSAYISGNMTAWKGVMDRMISGGIQGKAALLELTNYEYGYIGWCVGNKSYSEARKYLGLAERNLEILLQDTLHQSMVNSYKAAFYGYRISMNILSAPVLGLKSLESARMALKQDVNNAFAWVQSGNIEFYMPPVFGGSKAEALKYYLKALELMERHPGDLKENWNYLSLLVVITQSYYYLNDFQSAVGYLDKILAIEPHFVWVKDELYPQILKKMRR
jgi:tetratricopeptide (TPR) repeat protein